MATLHNYKTTPGIYGWLILTILKLLDSFPILLLLCRPFKKNSLDSSRIEYFPFEVVFSLFPQQIFSDPDNNPGQTSPHPLPLFTFNLPIEQLIGRTELYLYNPSTDSLSLWQGQDNIYSPTLLILIFNYITTKHPYNSAPQMPPPLTMTRRRLHPIPFWKNNDWPRIDWLTVLDCI